MTLASGTRLGRYEIRSKIGAGGMGEVYLAQDTKLDRKVALKILSADVAANHNRMRRFVQEAKAASALNHPNIITIHEIDLTDSVHFIATEFIDGETLRQRMNGAPIKLCEVLDLAAQIAGALSAAHAAGIVHRDVKPENIMLRRDGIVKVLDFGLAKLSEKAETGTVDTEAATKGLVQTEPGVVVGTAAYMSPEQARGLLVDARTDIFSLGVVIYEMVAGQAPFGGATRSDLIVALLERDPRPLARFTPEAPAELERMVMKTLAKDREERYQTAKDLLIDLKRLRQRLEVEAEIERTAEPHEKSSEVKAVATGSEQTAVATARAATVETGDAAVALSTSSAANLVKEVTLHKRGALIILAVLVAATIVAYIAYSRYAGARRAGTIRSVAVLPFVNKTNDADSEYLSEGISESLINSLSQLPGLKVIARNSSFKYKGPDVDQQEAARALGVDAILTGRVSQLGDNLVISAELVNARDNIQEWGERYNRKRVDVLQLPSDISREIAATLRLKLTNAEQQQLAKRETVNPQAYELLLKGRLYKNKFWGTEDEKKAIEYYQQAIAVDPAFALAYAELSSSYSVLYGYGLLDPKEFRP
jgi:serine/threonine protein kinase